MQKILDLATFLLGNFADGFFAALGVLAVFAGFWLIGRLFLGKSYGSSAALFGWGLIYLVTVISTLLGISSLRVPFVFFCVLAAVAFVNELRTRRSANWSVSVGLMVPIFILALVMPPLYWDSYMHWLPNAAYLVKFDAFPVAPLPDAFPSRHPTYPNAIPIITYFATLITGRFAEAATHITTVVLSFMSLQSAAKLIEDHLPAELRTSARMSLYVVPLAAFCIVLPLNPSFQTVHYWSAIADPALGMISFILIARWCSLMSAGEAQTPTEIAARHFTPSRIAAIRELALFFMIGAVISGLKQSGWVLVGILVAGGVGVGIVYRVKFARWFNPAAAALAGAMVSFVLWDKYLTSTLPLADVVILPLEEWRLSMIGDLAIGALIDIQTYYVYYAIVLGTLALALVSSIKQSLIKNTQFKLMYGLAAVAMTLHLASLVVAYLGSVFEDSEIERAASLQRYSTHIGFAMCTIVLAALTLRILPWISKVIKNASGGRFFLGAAATYVLLSATLIALPAISYAYYFQIRMHESSVLARKALTIVPAGLRTAILAEEWSTNLIHYLAWLDSGPTPKVPLVERQNLNALEDLPAARRRVETWIADPNIDQILLLDVQDLAIELGLEAAPDYLWSRQTHAWERIDLNRINPYQLVPL